MGFFSKLFGRKPEKKKAAQQTPPPPPAAPVHAPSDSKRTPDPGLGAAVVAEGKTLHGNGEWQALSALYRDSNFEQRSILLEGIGRLQDTATGLETWQKLYPEDPVAHLFSGVNLNFLAWEARGGKLAKDVGMDKWLAFGTYLKVAASSLERSIELDDKDAEPYRYMIRVLLGDGGLSKRAYMDLFQDVQQRQPQHLLAHMDVLTWKCEKWGGSHAQMWDFARQSVGQAPSGSLLCALVPMAVMERSVYYMIEEDYDGANAYMKSEEVKRELKEAWDKMSGVSGWDKSPLAAIALNWFACAMIYSNVKPDKVEALQLLGDRLADRPWAYIDVPVYGHVNRLRKDFGLPQV